MTMSVHMIYYKDGVKMMRPVPNREEYLKLRNGGFQQENVARIRQGDEALKSSLVQMNYSCLPNDDGTLKGSKRMSTTVGMDIDFVAPKELSTEEQQAWLSERMARVPELVMNKKDELGLQMFERSATKGYHLVFSRRPELSQEQNLKWASDLLGVKFDDNAKDITRVFFTTTEEELIYLDDAIFETTEAVLTNTNCTNHTNREVITTTDLTDKTDKKEASRSFPNEYHGIPFATILKKYWEVNNRGFEPTQGDRDTLTYQLACDLRHICGRNFEWLDQVIPCYDGFPIEEKRAKIKSALASEFNGFPLRLRNVLNSLTPDPGLTPDPSPKGRASPSPPWGELEEVTARHSRLHRCRRSSVGNAGGDGYLSLYRHVGYGCDAGRARTEEGTEPYLLYRR